MTSVIVVRETGKVYAVPEEFNRCLDPERRTAQTTDISTRLGTAAWTLVEVTDLPPDPPLTVGQLIARLETWPRDMFVLQDNGADWYCYISDVVGPDLYDRGVDGDEWSGEDTGFAQPTLVPGRAWDSRDL